MNNQNGRNKRALASLYTGSLSCLFFIIGYIWEIADLAFILGLLGGIIAAIIGNMARRQIKEEDGSRQDKLMATIGINLGLLPLLLLCLYFAAISPNLH